MAITSTERRRPIKQFEVIVAYGPYRVGDKIQPTGLYRDALLRRGLIKEIKEVPPVDDREVRQPDLDRMIAQDEQVSRQVKRR